MNYLKQWEFLKSKFESDSLSHAYLFSGQNTEAIESFAKEFIRFINGIDIKNLENFPDVMQIKSSDSGSSKKNENDMMEISVEQIRQTQNFLSYTSYYGGYKTVIVQNAERMSPQAQNCFLKSLEEPKGKTLIILLCDKSEMLLPTIISRCQEIKFFEGSLTSAKLNEELRGILQLDLAEKFAYTKSVNLEGQHFTDMLRGLQGYFRTLLLAKIGIGKAPENSYSMEKLKKIIKLIEKVNHQTAVSNANARLALEVLLMEI